ncbi:MAG: hypothetical protein JWN32_3874 [Solirubrobacterales bacterium]|nr:hypothetical protein [Solirubrobacterales bacterium]
MSSAAGLARLRATLEAEGGELAASLIDGATGPSDSGEVTDHELVIELIREGYLVHYGTGRVVRTDDPDLALLAGDRLYALGLARLAALGDLEAVSRLADLIAECAQAHAADDPARAERAWADRGVAGNLASDSSL